MTRDKMFEPNMPSPLVELSDQRLTDHDVRIWMKRDDLIHREIPGNKWRKLKYNLQAVATQRYDTLLTFGGAYSNHIRAVAAAGYYFGFKTIGVIRGEEHLPLNPSLAYAVGRGMRLIYLDRTTYRQKTDPAVVAALRDQFGEFYLIPEGGSNELAVWGCAEIPAEIAEDFDLICCACGTGGTLAGIAAGLRPTQQAVGFSALKGGTFLSGEVERLQQLAFGRVFDNWRIETRFHFGGYARRTSELDRFIEDFDKSHGIRLDWVYVAKMMYGIFYLIEHDELAAGTRLVAVITGS